MVSLVVPVVFQQPLESLLYNSTSDSKVTRELRSKKNVNYCELADLQLPRARRKHHLDTSNELFPVCILEKSEHHVKVQYVGFASKYDKWKDESELESLETDEVVEEDSEDGSSVTSYFQPYCTITCLYKSNKYFLVVGRVPNSEDRYAI